MGSVGKRSQRFPRRSQTPDLRRCFTSSGSCLPAARCQLACSVRSSTPHRPPGGLPAALASPPPRGQLPACNMRNPTPRRPGGLEGGVFHTALATPPPPPRGQLPACNMCSPTRNAPTPTLGHRQDAERGPRWPRSSLTVATAAPLHWPRFLHCRCSLHWPRWSPRFLHWPRSLHWPRWSPSLRRRPAV